MTDKTRAELLAQARIIEVCAPKFHDPGEADLLVKALRAQAEAAGEPVAVPTGYLCELAALTRLSRDIVSLPLHDHKRAIVRKWIASHISSVEAEAQLAKTAPPADRARELLKEALEQLESTDYQADIELRIAAFLKEDA